MLLAKKQNERQRSNSEESIDSVVMEKQSRPDGKPLISQDEVWKVVVDQSGGPDLLPIHITKASDV